MNNKENKTKKNMDNKDLRVYLCISRHKDNEQLVNFKPRTTTFIAYDGKESIEKRFEEFVRGGLVGEKCRLYKSVNLRDEEKIKKHLAAHLLLSETPVNITHLNSITAGIAAKKECALEKKWLFDFDTKDTSKLQEFLEDIKKCPKGEDLEPEVTETVNGFAVVVEHGFDTRSLLAKYKDFVELKKDDLLFVKIEEKM